MKRKLTRLSRRYASALRAHLNQGPRASLQPARVLGRQAVSLGLETLDVARIHQRALATLEASSSRDGVISRAELFFSEAVTPIERTHRAALTANAHVNQVNKMLHRRTAALAAVNRSLTESIGRRKTVEEALKRSGAHSKKLLNESRHLQKHLQRLTHRLLSAQEDSRKKVSHDLQDEIAQTLLGINVRLLTLRKVNAVNARGLKKEIASTRRLVDKSVRSINRFAHDLSFRHES